MSAEAIAHAFKYPTNHAAMTLVLLAMADTVNDQNDNLFWMSHSGIAAKTGLTRVTVLRACERLLAEGRIVLVEKRLGETNTYRYQLDTPVNATQEVYTVDAPPLYKDDTQTQVSNSSKLKLGERDEIWDALCLVCGIDDKALTKTARGELNAAVKELRDVGATAGGIESASVRWKRRYAEITLTPSALKKHWASLQPPVDKVVTELYPSSVPVEQFIGAKILTPQEIEFNQERIRELQDKFHDR